jgi:signal peptidase I
MTDLVVVLLPVLAIAAVATSLIKPSKSLFCARRFMTLVVYACCIVVITLSVSRAVGVKVWKVSGDSMLPTLTDGDSTVCIRPNYEAGDIVQIVSPESDGSYWVKRIIGVPGDRIAVWGNHVEVNGVADPTSEKYEKSTLRPRVLVLQYGEYFVCGDNREVSYDSRYVGPIDKNLILTETLFSF